MDVQLPDGTTVQGVPDGTTKAQLAEKLKANGRDVPADWLAQPKPEPKEKPTDFRKEIGGAIAEPLMAMGSGMAGKFAGDVAGLGAIPLHAAGAIKTEPKDVQRGVQSAMTYQPRTAAGASPFNYAAGKVEQAGADRGPVHGPLSSGVAEAIRNLPMFLGGPAKGAVEGTAGAMKSGARDVMQGALKPSAKAQQTGKADTAIDTMLEQGINVSRGGIQKMEDRIGVLNDKITNLIADSPATIDKSAVADRLRGLSDKFIKRVNPTSSLKAIQDAWDEFLDHPLLTGKQDIPVQLAQEMKQATTKGVRDTAYGEQKTAPIEAQKQLARGLKEEIAAAVPQVRALNAEESQLLTALPLVERRVLNEANKNLAGLGWLTTSPAKFAAWMGDRSSLFKSLVARMLNAGAEPVKGMAPAAPAAMFAIGAQQQPDRAPSP